MTDPKTAIPGGRYHCAGCGYEYASPGDAAACCSNMAEFSPKTAPLGPDPDEDEEALGEVMEDQEEQGDR